MKLLNIFKRNNVNRTAPIEPVTPTSSYTCSNRRLTFDNIQECTLNEEQYSFSMRFKDQKLEQDFCSYFYGPTALRLKISLTFALVVWASFLIMDFKETKTIRGPYVSLRFLLYIYAVPVVILLYTKRIQKSAVAIEVLLCVLQTLFCLIKITQGSLRFQTKFAIADLAVIVSAMMTYFRAYSRVTVNAICIVISILFSALVTLIINLRFLTGGREVATKLILNIVYVWFIHGVSFVYSYYLEQFARRAFLATRVREEKQKLAKYEVMKSVAILENIVPKIFVPELLSDNSDLKDMHTGTSKGKYELAQAYSEPKMEFFEDVSILLCNFSSFVSINS
jgi:hypothetical protein